MITPPVFEPLPMRRRAVVPISAEEYAIISRRGEVREVKANTAYEAFKLSGFDEAIRIERKAVVKQPVLAKTRFTDEAPVVSPDEAEALQRRKSPVISANDLDAMMRMLQIVESTQIPDEQEKIPHIITNPTGMEVHGDGFDEIIPATVAPMHMAGIRSAADTVSIDESPPEIIVELPPEQELTPDEVTRLLSGKE